MEPETKRMIEESLKLAREDHTILKKMQSNMRWTRVFRIFYWIFVIGSMLGAYYYLQPLIDETVKQFESVKSAFTGLKESTESADQVLNKLNSLPL